MPPTIDYEIDVLLDFTGQEAIRFEAIWHTDFNHTPYQVNL